MIRRRAIGRWDIGRRSLLGAGLLLLGFGCKSHEPLEMPVLSTAHVSSDFETYGLRRVGLMPFAGDGVDEPFSLALQEGFFAEVSRSTPFELVVLNASMLAEIEDSSPYRKGWYQPRTIVELARRYSLDGMLFGTVTQQRFYPPQSLSVQMDMVAAETGLVIWSSAVHLDASEESVRTGLKIYYGGPLYSDYSESGWELALLSPERFGRFAAYQIARLL